MRTAAALLLLASALAAAAAPWAEAGGGPETTIVVANASSPSSMRVANEWARMRRLPATHVVVVEGAPGTGVVPVEVFREALWKPVRAWLDANDPQGRIDTIAWSVDFPYGVDFAGDAGTYRNPPISPVASITAMTYLARRVEKKDADGYLSLTANGYYRRYAEQATFAPRERPAEAEKALREAQAAIAQQKWEEAAKAYEAALAADGEDFAAWYDLACCRARTGKGDAAMECLSKAVAHGWTNAAHTKTDADLESLRSRPDFAALLHAMEKAAAASSQAGTWPSRAFSARRAWTGGEAPVEVGAEASDDRYRLSVTLGYAGPQGNSVPEVLEGLARSAAADGTNPAGTVYVCANGDVRSTTRAPRFEACVEALKAMGRAAALLEAGKDGQTGVVPVGKDDVVGAVVGTAGFSWGACKSRLLPGAIAEHLTSFGAAFDGTGQTKISEWIRAGAAGTCGAVREPYALEAKFPVPHLHVHYAAGCSLAEAFFQSVWGPYQLLVVGDPLARPFARFARVTLGAPATSSPWAGKVAVRADAVPASGRPLERVELWVDGRFVAEAPVGTPVEWDTTTVEDGAHEVRVVAVEASLVATRSSAEPAFVTVANATTPPPTIGGLKAAVLDGDLVLIGRAPAGSTVDVWAGSRVVASVPASGGAWKASVPATRLGLGESLLQARAVGSSGSAVRSAFWPVRVDPPAAKRPWKTSPKTAPGFLVAWVDAKGKPGDATVASLGGHGTPGFAKQLEGKFEGMPKSLAVTGEFETKASGLWQLDVDASGSLELKVDGKPVLVEPKAARGRWSFALVSLEAGWHSLELRLVPAGTWDLTVLLAGDSVASPLSAPSARHPAK
jgi:hypothetical protein